MMKKIFFLLFLLVSVGMSAQVSYVGEYTTTQRNTVTVPSGRRALLWNSTTGKFEMGTSAAAWLWLIQSGDIDTYSELNTIVSDVTLTHNGLIDTFAELNTIVADATLIKSGDNISSFTNDSGYITSETDDQTASEVNITDSGGYYTGTEVETALQEIGADIASLSGSGISDGDKGDITVSSSGSVWTIDNDVIDASNLADADLGDISVSTGVVSIDSGVVGSTEITDGSVDELDLDTSVNASLDLADSALQSGDNISSLTNDSGYITSQTDDQTASEVNITDSGAYYTGTDVEAALQEIGADIASFGGGSSLPVDDTTSLVQDPVDGTKEMRIDVGTVSTGTVRTLTMPDADVDLGQVVVGPASATDNAIARFDATTGKIIQNSTATLSDIGILTASILTASTRYQGADQTDAAYAPGTSSGGIMFINNGMRLATGTNTNNLKLTYGALTSLGTLAFTDSDVTWNGSSLFGTDDQTASEVNITDTGAYYTGTNVEAALQEIGADLASTVGDPDQTLSLGGTGNKDLTISGTGGNTIDLTGVDGVDADNIVSKGTARTSPVQYTDIYGQTLANYNTDGAPGAGELVIITDASDYIEVALSDYTTDLTTGTSKAYFRAPFAMTVTDVRASVLTAPVGSTIIVDINENGTSIMTTNKLSIDASEKTSTTAATAAGITDTSIADDAEITFDIDQVGSSTAGAGLLVKIYYR